MALWLLLLCIAAPTVRVMPEPGNKTPLTQGFLLYAYPYYTVAQPVYSYSGSILYLPVFPFLSWFICISVLQNYTLSFRDCQSSSLLYDDRKPRQQFSSLFVPVETPIRPTCHACQPNKDSSVQRAHSAETIVFTVPYSGSSGIGTDS